MNRFPIFFVNYLILIKNIKKSYYDGIKKVDIFDSINLEVADGEKIAITGDSGSGKSTLLHIISLLDFPDFGEIFINDINVFNNNFNFYDFNNSEKFSDSNFFQKNKIFKNSTIKKNSQILKKIFKFLNFQKNRNKEETKNNLKNFSKIDTLRGKNIGYVFQSHPLIYELTTIENIIIPQLIMKTADSYSEAEFKAKSILKIVGLQNRLNYRPSLLSGGEKQRVAIARAIINNPKIIVADEPTGSLDEKNSMKVIELLEKISFEFKTAILMATHNKEIASRFQKTFKIQNKKIIQIK